MARWGWSQILRHIGQAESGERRTIGIEDVKPEDWAEKVYKPDILAEPETVYKKPGYDPL